MLTCWIQPFGPQSRRSRYQCSSSFSLRAIGSGSESAATTSVDPARRERGLQRRRGSHRAARPAAAAGCEDVESSVAGVGDGRGLAAHRGTLRVGEAVEGAGVEDQPEAQPTSVVRSAVTSPRTIRIGTPARLFRLRARRAAVPTSSTPVTSQPRSARRTPHAARCRIPTSSARPNGRLRALLVAGEQPAQRVWRTADGRQFPPMGGSRPGKRACRRCSSGESVRAQVARGHPRSPRPADRSG